MLSSNWLLWGGIATLARFVLFFVGADTYLSSSIELIAPTTSYKRLTEGIFFANNGLSPYSGSVFLQPPLVLPLFMFGDKLGVAWIAKWWPRLILIVTDVLLSLTLFFIGDMVQKSRKIAKQDEHEPNPLRDNLGSFMAATYYLNPVIIASCVSMSTTNLNLLPIALTIYFALKQNMSMSTLCAAFATYFHVYCIILVFAIPYIPKKQQRSSLFKCLFLFLFWACVLIFLSYSVMGYSWTFVERAYLYPLMLRDLTPNWGNFWYFFTEVFDYFRSFFLIMFHLHILAYIAPLWIRFKHDGLFMITIMIAIVCVFKPYPTFADMFFYIIFLFMFTYELSPYMKFGFFVSVLLIASAVLGPVFYNTWIYKGTGNANFFYFITLLNLLSHILLIMEYVQAKLKMENFAKNGMLHYLNDE